MRPVPNAWAVIGFEIVAVGGDIQAAIDRLNAASGGEVRLAPGTHTITTTLTLKTGVTLRGQIGAGSSAPLSRLVVSVAGIGITMQSGTHVRNLQIEGDSTVATTQLIDMNGVSETSVIGCHIRLGGTGTGNGIRVLGTSLNIIISQNIFSVTGTGTFSALKLTNGENIAVSGNYFVNNTATPCISIDPAASGLLRASIVGNSVNTGSSGADGIDVNANATAICDLSISGNIVVGNANANSVGIDVNLNSGTTSIVTVTANTIAGFSGTSAIGVRTQNIAAGTCGVIGNADRSCTTGFSLAVNTGDTGNI